MLNAQGGFTQARLWLPRCDKPPNRYYVIIAQRRSGRGDRLLSPPSSYQHVVFQIMAKGILQSPEKVVARR
jgi:hypothetical protein